MIAYITAFLVIGVMINAAVTWGCWKWANAWRCDWTWADVTKERAPCLTAVVWSAPATVRAAALPCLDNLTVDFEANSLHSCEEEADSRVHRAYRRFVRNQLLQRLDDDTIAEPLPRAVYLDAQGWGWPLLSAYGSEPKPLDVEPKEGFTDDPTLPSLDVLAQLSAFDRLDYTPMTAPPPFRGILWNGAVVNALFYALVSATLFGWLHLLIVAASRLNAFGQIRCALLTGALAVLTTVSIAWMGAAIIDPLADADWDYMPRSGAGDLFGEEARHYQFWLVREFTDPGVKIISSSWDDGGIGGGIGGGWPDDPPEAVLPWWWGESLTPSVPARTSGQSHRRLGEAWGWPFLAMWCEWRWDASHLNREPGFDECFYGLPLEGTSSSESRTYQHHDRALPLAIVWPGFLLNVVIYWWAWLTLWIGFTSLKNGRAWRRRRKGQCVRCAYDLRSIDADRCPECGEPIRPVTKEGNELPTGG